MLGDFGQSDWPGGAWGTPLGPNSGGADWRVSPSGRGAGHGHVGGYRPKRRFCTSYPETSMCRRGATCAFAHSREEISAPLLDIDEEQQDPAALTDDFFMYKYKTRWCPIGVQHEWHTCVYAHNYQDARRPVLIGYGARLCPYWSKKDTGAEYSQRCPLGLRCPYSHGAKEQLYHPHYFKTVVCRDLKGKACPRQLLCAFFHHRQERRVSPADDVDYSHPLLNEALPEDWIADFLAPPFLPESSKGGGGCSGVEDGMCSKLDGGNNGNGNNVVPYAPQMPNGGPHGPYGQHLPPGAMGAPGPCVILLPIGGMMPPGSPNSGGPARMNSELQSPPAGALPGLPPNWVFVPMDGNGHPSY